MKERLNYCVNLSSDPLLEAFVQAVPLKFGFHNVRQLKALQNPAKLGQGHGAIVDAVKVFKQREQLHAASAHLSIKLWGR